jgi:hypothetical protein
MRTQRVSYTVGTKFLNIIDKRFALQKDNGRDSIRFKTCPSPLIYVAPKRLRPSPITKITYGHMKAFRKLALKSQYIFGESEKGKMMRNGRSYL